MDEHEVTLLHGALRSAHSIVLHSMDSSEQDILGVLAAEYDTAKPIDWRGDVPDQGALTQTLRAAVEKPKLAILLLGTPIPPPVQQALQDTLPSLPSQTDEGRREPRLVALANTDTLPDSVTSMFELSVSGMKAIRAAQTKRSQEAEALRAAQDRAQQSSRDHGLV